MVQILERKSLSPNKLVQLKPLPVPWASSNRLSHRHETVLTRLSIGHSRLTHLHTRHYRSLPTELSISNIDFFPVDYLFAGPHLKQLREIHHPHDRIKALTDNESVIDNILKYLSQTVFLSLI